MSFGRNTSRIIERIRALNKMKVTADNVQPGIKSPSAVPAAGGCSVFVNTMMKMLMPTDRAATTSRIMRNSSEADSNAGICNANASIEPTMTAAICPPITLRGEVATLFGTTKTVKAVDATATTMAALNTASSTSRMTISETVARPHWKMYLAAGIRNSCPTTHL